MGDFKFDPKYWPDIPGMMKNLSALGIKQVMVSTWPFTATNSSSFEKFGSEGLVFTERDSNNPIFWDDNNCGDVGGCVHCITSRHALFTSFIMQLSHVYVVLYYSPAKCYIYDPTQKAAREAYWQGLHSGYYQYGIKVFWLDASEPEISTAAAQSAADSYNNSLGNYSEVGMMYP